MPGEIVLRAPRSITRGASFIVSVDVLGATPGHDVTVTLEQAQGAEPAFLRESKVTTANAGGSATASFNVSLTGPSITVLVATAFDRGARVYIPSAAGIEVT